MIGLSTGIGFTKFIGGGGTPPVHTPQTYALVGNSLFNFGLDQSVASILAGLAHPTDTVVQQITFNQNLTTNWNDPAGRTTGIDVKAYLASDSADYLGMVDLPGINDSLVDPAVSVVDWWNRADNDDLRGTFYQMWYPVAGWPGSPDWTLWKALVTFLRPHHDRVLYDVRAALGGPEVLLAPVADVLVAIYDAIEAEELDADFTDFWYDALHINELGYYVAALTHWAVMHQQSPVGLPWEFDPAIPGLDATLAAGLQAIVWDVVDADAYAKPGSWPSTVIPAAFASGQWSVDPGDEEIEITIDSLPNNGGASITDIEYELDASGSWTSSGGTASFTITGLTNDTEYDIRIRAKNSVGSGRASDVKAETPEASDGLTLVSTNMATANTLTISAHQAGDLIIGFAYRNADAIPATRPGDWSGPAGSGANANSIIWGWKVAASGAETFGTWTNANYCGVAVFRNHGGIGANALSGTNGTTPALPAITLQGSAATSLILRGIGARNGPSMATPANHTNPATGGSGIVGTKLFLAAGSESGAVTVVTSGNGARTFSIEILPPTTPAAFTSGLWTATPGVDKIEVGGFTLPFNGGAAITDVEYRVNGGSPVSLGNTTGGDITGLTRGTSYDIQIRAVNANGAGPWSDTKARIPPWQCSLTASLFDFGGGDGFRGAGFSPWGLNFGSKDREPIPGLTLIAAYTYTVNGETFIAFQGDQTAALGGMSVWIGETQHTGTWVYNASSDYGVGATILVSNASPITNGVHDMQIRASSP